MNTASADQGSYRDPGGRVYRLGDRVLRTVMPVAAEDFEFVESSGLMDDLAERGWVNSDRRVDAAILGKAADGAHCVIEHQPLPFVSYPYEWPFPALKAAALLQLDIMLRALHYDVALSDASAYNVQFLGGRAVFIDRLSFRRYQEGEFWAGHRQFCEQFLNPLLMVARVGIPYNAWYRGRLEGVPTQALNRMLPLKSKFSWNIFSHVVMQSRFQQSASGSSEAERKMKSMKLPRSGFEAMLTGLRRWIKTLEPRHGEKSTWQDYDHQHSYSSEEEQTKRDLIAEFVAETRPDMLWDMGCNSGEYSQLALDSGAGHVVGFDADHGALDRAFHRATEQELNFLPLYLDATNPAPDQGWSQSERMGLAARQNADAVLALALVHHLAIGANVPLVRVVKWLVDSAPQGVIEFVPKTDPMVTELLRLRSDIFADYDEATFEAELKRRARITKVVTVSSGQRKLYWYRRNES